MGFWSVIRWICEFLLEQRSHSPCGTANAHNLEGVSDNADGHELLAVVAAVHHQRVGQALNDGAVGLAEALDGIAASRVRNVDRGADLDVIAAEKAGPLVAE